MKKTVNERIKTVRNELGMNQTDFSYKVDMSTSLISKIESGDLEPSAKLIKRIAEKYGVDVNWLLKGEGILKVNLKSEPQSDNPWRDEAYASLKADMDYLKEQYNKVLNRLLDGGNLGKSKALKYAGKLKQVA